LLVDDGGEKDSVTPHKERQSISISVPNLIIVLFYIILLYRTWVAIGYYGSGCRRL